MSLQRTHCSLSSCAERHPEAADTRGSAHGQGHKGSTLLKIAMLSFHGCPFARLGEKDSGGMNVYVLQAARELARRGHSIDIFTRYHDPNDLQVDELEYGVRLVHLKAGPYDSAKEGLYEYIPEFLTSLEAFHRSSDTRYDIVHSHYWLSGPVGEILSERWNAPHAITFHTLAKKKKQARSDEHEPEIRSAVEQRSMERADAIVVSTGQEREDIRHLYGESSRTVKVVPAGVDLDLFKPIQKEEARRTLGLSESKIVLYVGRLEPLKGLDILLEAVWRLEDRADTRLLVVGGSLQDDDELGRLKASADRMGIADIVTFTGSIKQSDLPVYYSAADVFVLPSYYESFGLVALEAMACGAPVVASRVGGLKTFVENGVTGYLIPWRCPEPFAQRLDMLLANPSLREKLGKAGRAAALEMGWGRTADSLIDLYLELLGSAWQRVAGA